MSNARPPRPYVDPTSLAAEAAAAPLSPEPVPSWQQASARPRAAPKPRPAPRVASQAGYVTRHWRGELSLARSYWVNNLLMATPLALLLTGLMSWIGAIGDSLQVSAITVLVGMPLLLALNVWCLVGAWRAASNYLRERGSLLWGWLARLSLGLGALQLLASVGLGLLPNLGEFWQMARGIDPLGQARFSLSADGRSLRMDGVIGMGDGERLRVLLASEAARGLKRVELVSPGGRVREAEHMAQAVKQHGHAVRAVGTCASACTLVFLAGSPRQLSPEAQLGFHRASTGSYNPVFDEIANQQLAQTYRELGLPQSMIDKTLDTPARSMWFVPRAELAAHALIAAAPPTLAVPLPPTGPGVTQADFDDALQQHPVWEALEQRSPGLLAATSQRMWQARVAGASDEDVQAAALPSLAGLMPTLINSGDAQLRRRYIQLVAEQLQALRQPPEGGTRPACRDLLEGRLGVRQQLPVPLQAREARWVLEAAQAAPPRWLPRPPSAVELEVLDRTTGRAALGLLSRLWADTPAGSGAGTACEPVLALLGRLQGQPPARRELAERLLFQAGR